MEGLRGRVVTRDARSPIQRTMAAHRYYVEREGNDVRVWCRRDDDDEAMRQKGDQYKSVKDWLAKDKEMIYMGVADEKKALLWTRFVNDRRPRLIAYGKAFYLVPDGEGVDVAVFAADQSSEDTLTDTSGVGLYEKDRLDAVLKRACGRISHAGWEKAEYAGVVEESMILEIQPADAWLRWLGVKQMVHRERPWGIGDALVERGRNNMSHSVAKRIAQSAYDFIAADEVQKGQREESVLMGIGGLDVWEEEQSQHLIQEALDIVRRRVNGHDIGIGALRPRGSFGHRLDLEESGPYGEGA